MTRMNSMYLMATLVALALCACGGGGTTANAQTVSPSASFQTTGVIGTPPPAAAIATGTFTVEGNSSTVAGVDSVGRGYRDDVAQLIAEKFSSDPIVKTGAIMFAVSYQKSIAVPLMLGQDTSDMVMAAGRVGRCAAYLPGLADDQALYKAVRAIYARTFNTDARMATRQAFINAATHVNSQSIDPKTCVSP